MVELTKPGNQPWRQHFWSRPQVRAVFLGCLAICLSACVVLSNRVLRQDLAPAQGIVRVGIVLQRWPHFLAQPHQNSLGSDFIRDRTPFFGPWQPAQSPNPHAMDVADVTDAHITLTLVEALRARGYEAELISLPLDPEAGTTVRDFLDKYGSGRQDVDGWLFCYYAPTLFVTDKQFLPAGAQKRAIGLAELARGMGREGNLSWAGKRRSQASVQSISHAFIYFSMSLFSAQDGQPVWMVAESRVGGRIRPLITECPPGPTDRDYPADAAMVQRIMLNNLRCRLRHLLPDALDR